MDFGLNNQSLNDLRSHLHHLALQQQQLCNMEIVSQSHIRFGFSGCWIKYYKIKRALKSCTRRGESDDTDINENADNSSASSARFSSFCQVGVLNTKAYRQFHKPALD